MRALRITSLLACGLMTAPIVFAGENGKAAGVERYIPGFDYALSVRYRYESVSQDNALHDAAASTARTRLTLSAKPLEHLGALLEIDNVSAIGVDHYDSFARNEYRGTYSVIADPVGTEVNQAALSYSLDPAQSLVLGRQRIVHGNQRFVGGVAWRQNEQTYDAASYRRRGEALDVDYSYVWNVNRVFEGRDPSVQITDFDSASHLLLASCKQPWGTVSGYAYALDFDNAPALSSLTYGLGYATKLGPVALDASVAEQSDYADNPQSYDAAYLALDAGADLGPVHALLGYEMLGSDDGVAAFQTPLATLHLYQGWADLFLATPDSGVEDTYLTLSGKLAGVALAATYHDLRAAEGSADYGAEWDLSAGYTVNRYVGTQLKYATYDSKGFAVDTDKLWFTVNLTF
jgi:hypothetical protein